MKKLVCCVIIFCFLGGITFTCDAMNNNNVNRRDNNPAITQLIKNSMAWGILGLSLGIVYYIVSDGINFIISSLSTVHVNGTVL